MAYPPTVSDFKARFDRDFVYGTGMDAVRDVDVTNALSDAIPLFNQSLWSSTVETTTAFLLLAAHFLRMNLDAAGGLAARNLSAGMDQDGGGTVEGKSVGPISLTYAIPEWVRRSPVWSPFLQTRYGARYVHMAWPRTVGAAAVAGGFIDSDVKSNDASQT